MGTLTKIGFIGSIVLVVGLALYYFIYNVVVTGYASIIAIAGFILVGLGFIGLKRDFSDTSGNKGFLIAGILVLANYLIMLLYMYLYGLSLIPPLFHPEFFIDIAFIVIGVTLILLKSDIQFKKLLGILLIVVTALILWYWLDFYIPFELYPLLDMFLYSNIALGITRIAQAVLLLVIFLKAKPK